MAKLIIVFMLPFVAILAAKLTVQPIHMCEYQGHKFPIGSEYRPTDCTTCRCESSGRPSCLIADCFFVPCVDSVHIPGQCCNHCPTGNNCYALNGKIIKAGSEIKIDDNTFCTCPAPWVRPNNATCRKTLKKKKQ
ncbi:hypothetical protein LOTGIDRAFT_162320 [Lottia gigantea]|uniref:VWC2L C-terminal domain-containing protein n=1 Tax=Lottia gigantea TaxID=225164 RepID=V4BV17_LOTGI|nr:hypothetical protein LOTGIDRAFT_162320 [Lottia gigantea]ESO92844.1 hypothetical protein LOTGIDRAFT_162320 [Lottia gigantea]